MTANEAAAGPAEAARGPELRWLSHGAWFIAGFALAFSVLLAIAAVSYRSVNRYAASAQWVDHTRLVIGSLDNVMYKLKDAEIWQHGFLVTGDERHLVPYVKATEVIPNLLSSLGRGTRDNPPQQAAIAALSDLIALKLELMEGRIRLKKSRRPADVTLLKRDREVTDRIRAQVELMKAEEHRLLAQHSADLESDTAATRRVIVSGNLTALFFLVVSGGLLLRAIAARKRTEAEREQFFTLALKLNADLTARAAQLDAANQELESFSYSVSHDLRSPLRAIGGYALMLEEDYRERLDDEGRRLLRTVRDNAARMARLIDDLLAFSRLGRTAVAAATVDMEALAREVAAQLPRDSVSTRAQLRIEALPAGYGDRALLRQVWLNLLGNAFKYSGKREAPLIEVNGRVEGGECIYCVKDNGAGFDMRYYDKLFGVFQRLHGADEFAGTGVGLAIVQRIVTRHGGRVWAEGRPDAGASFYFSLPA